MFGQQNEVIVGDERFATFDQRLDFYQISFVLKCVQLWLEEDEIHYCSADEVSKFKCRSQHSPIFIDRKSEQKKIPPERDFLNQKMDRGYRTTSIRFAMEVAPVVRRA